MADNRTLALHATLPQRYARFDVLAATIDHRRRLLALLVDRAAADLPWHRTRPWKPPAPPFDALVVIRDGNAEHRIPLRDLDQRFTEIDALGDGVVLGAARIPPTDPANALPRNVVAFDGNGTPVGACYAGDGMNQLSTDPSGRIWISYTDESTYQFTRPDGTRATGFMIGLARWDTLGSTPWFAYNDTGNAVDWCDCYVLNVGRAVVHTCPYTEYPLIEADGNGVRAITPNPLGGCLGLAVADSTLAFLDQHLRNDIPVWRIRRAHRTDGVITETGTEILTLPDGRSPVAWVRGRVGRDGTLWLHENGNPRRWYRYDL